MSCAFVRGLSLTSSHGSRCAGQRDRSNGEDGGAGSLEGVDGELHREERNDTDIDNSRLSLTSLALLWWRYSVMALWASHSAPIVEKLTM